jgi:hypothetical protein
MDNANLKQTVESVFSSALTRTANQPTLQDFHSILQQSYQTHARSDSWFNQSR